MATPTLSSSKLNKCAEVIQATVYGDARVSVELGTLCIALREDFARGGRLPTLRECRVLVLGVEGEVPLALERAYPATYAAIAAAYT